MIKLYEITYQVFGDGHTNTVRRTAENKEQLIGLVYVSLYNLFSKNKFIKIIKVEEV